MSFRLRQPRRSLSAAPAERMPGLPAAKVADGGILPNTLQLASGQILIRSTGSVVPVLPFWQRNRQRLGPSATQQDMLRQIRLAHESGQRVALVDALDEALSDTNLDLAVVAAKVPTVLSQTAPVVVATEAAEGSGLDKGLAEEIRQETERQITSCSDWPALQASLGWARWYGVTARELQWQQDGARAYLCGASVIEHWRLMFDLQRRIHVLANRVDCGVNWAPPSSAIAIAEVPGKFAWRVPNCFDEVAEREGVGWRVLQTQLFLRYAVGWFLELVEEFGQPWKWLEEGSEGNAAVINKLTKEERQDALDWLEQLSSRRGFVSPLGMALKTWSPQAGAEVAHTSLIELLRTQITRFLLWQTRTTEASGEGLGSAQSQVHQDGETLLIRAECSQVAACLSRDVAQTIAAWNWGDEGLRHASKITLPYDPPVNTIERSQVVASALTLGLPVLRSEAYAAHALTAPAESDDVVQAQLQQQPAAMADAFSAGFGGGLLPLGASAARLLQRSNTLLLSRYSFPRRS